MKEVSSIWILKQKEQTKKELWSHTDARGGGGRAAFDGSGAAEEDEAGASGFGGGDGGERVTAPGTRGIVVGIPIGL